MNCIKKCGVTNKIPLDRKNNSKPILNRTKDQTSMFLQIIRMVDVSG